MSRHGLESPTTSVPPAVERPVAPTVLAEAPWGTTYGPGSRPPDGKRFAWELDRLNAVSAQLAVTRRERFTCRARDGGLLGSWPWLAIVHPLTGRSCGLVIVIGRYWLTAGEVVEDLGPAGAQQDASAAAVRIVAELYRPCP